MSLKGHISDHLYLTNIFTSISSLFYLSWNWHVVLSQILSLWTDMPLVIQHPHQHIASASQVNLASVIRDKNVTVLAVVVLRTTWHNSEAKSLTPLILGETPNCTQDLNDILWLKCVWNKSRCASFVIITVCVSLFNMAVSSCWDWISLQ